MKIIDISWPISEQMTGYADRKSVRLVSLKTISKDGSRQSMFTLDTHTGTHIDAPSHFLDAGDTVEKIPIDTFIGPALVLDLTSVSESITRADLEQYELPLGGRILLKTRNSYKQAQDRFDYGFVYLDRSAAAYLVEKKIKLIGIDYLGLERNQPENDTHRLLLGNGISILEGIRLQQAEAGDYTLLCLPLAVQGLEAAPARAVLIKDFRL